MSATAVDIAAELARFVENQDGLDRDKADLRAKIVELRNLPADARNSRETAREITRLNNEIEEIEAARTACNENARRIAASLAKPGFAMEKEARRIQNANIEKAITRFKKVAGEFFTNAGDAEFAANLSSTVLEERLALSRIPLCELCICHDVTPPVLHPDVPLSIVIRNIEALTKSLAEVKARAAALEKGRP